MTVSATRKARAGFPGLGKVALPFLLLTLLFTQHLLFGAEQPRVALLAAIAQLIILPGALLAFRPQRAGFPNRWIWTPFFGVLVIGVVQLIPVGAVVGNPAWTFVNLTPRISLDPWATRMELVKLLGLGALFVAAIQIGHDDAQRGVFLNLLVAGTIAYAVWALIVRAPVPDALPTAYPNIYRDRLTASFLSPNTAGSFFGVGVVIGIGAAARSLRGKASRGWALLKAIGPPLALLAACLAGLIQSGSRGGIAATLTASLLVLALWIWTRSARNKVSGAVIGTVLALMALAGVLFVLGGQTLTERMGSLDADLLERGQLYVAYWRAFQASPLFGYGLGSFHQVNAQLAPSSSPMDFLYVGSAHNVYLQWLMEAGLPATLCMAVVFAAIGLVCARGYFRSQTAKPYVLIALGATTLLLLHGLTDFALQLPSISALLTVLLGVACGASSRNQ